jgi:hypothetical protein
MFKTILRSNIVKTPKGSVTVEIKSCLECKHCDHTGAFTKDGAKPCCNHNKTVEKFGYNCFKRVIPYHTSFDETFHREIRTPKTIPVWCPLRQEEMKSGTIT